MISALQRTPAPRLHCEVDSWDFDPRYTAGACPICGWAPEAIQMPAVPAWQTQLAWVPWDYVGLAALFVALVALGIFVAIAAKINLVPS
ncbi:MAG: hypothetical protein ABR573_10335 [Candidatus Dormibacteria bacterium]